MAQLSAWLLADLLLNAAAFLCGVVCASALAVAQGEFGGRCILYGSVGYNGTLSISSSSPASLCYFILAVSGLTAVSGLASLLCGIYSCCYSDGRSTGRLRVKASLVLSATVLFLLLVSACILRVGLDSFCGSIKKSTALASCQEAQHHSWVQPDHAERFYDNLYAAGAAAWANFFAWCLMAILLFVRCACKAPSQPLQEDAPWTDEKTPILGDRAQ